MELYQSVQNLLQVERTQLGYKSEELSIYLNLLAALGLEVYLVRNVNEYDRQKIFLWIRTRPVREAINVTRHLRADCLDNVLSLISHNLIGLDGLLRG
jgi:hypothetical protein